jgi:hypothetical protein
MSHEEVKVLGSQLTELRDILVEHIEVFNAHVKKSDAHIEKMEPIVDRIDQLTTVGDVVNWTEKAKGWAIWWAGFITPLAIVGGAILAIIKLLALK